MKLLKKSYFLSVCLVCLLHIVHAHALSTTPGADSLYKSAVISKDILKRIDLAKRAYEQAKLQNKKSTEIKALYLIAKSFWMEGKVDSANFYGQLSLQTSQKSHIDSLEANTWVILGLVDYSKGAYENAINKYNSALTLYQKQKSFLKIAITLKNIGICESELSKSDAAISHFLMAVKTFESLKDSSNLASSYNAIALCFVSLKNYPKAIEYNKKALKIRELLRNDKAVAQSYNNLGYAFKQAFQPDSAIFYLSKCLSMRKDAKDTSILVLTLQNLGSSYKMKGNYSKALPYLLRSLRIAANYHMQEETARGNLDLAELYTAEKKYKEALAAVKIAEKTAAGLKLPELLMNTYFDEFNLYGQSGDYKNAVIVDNKGNRIKDSLFTVAKDRAINELEIKYQTAQRLNDIAALNTSNKLQAKVVRQQNISITVLIIAAFLLLLLLIIVYNNFRIKNRANERIQLLMRELHHRIKNNLQILSGLFMMQIDSLNDEKTKNTLRENESRLASMNLIHNKLYLDNSTTQIEMREYLTKLLQHIKDSFGGAGNEKVRLRIDVEPLKLEADKAVAIGLIVNELATNAFKYAFNGKKDGEIYLALKAEGKSKLLFTLGDNGRGIVNDEAERGKSFGLKLVNLMATQLHASLVTDTRKGALYKMEIGV